MKIVIVVHGGVVTSVATDAPSVAREDVVVVDFDNIDAGDNWPDLPFGLHYGLDGHTPFNTVLIDQDSNATAPFRWVR